MTGFLVLMAARSCMYAPSVAIPHPTVKRSSMNLVRHYTLAPKFTAPARSQVALGSALVSRSCASPPWDARKPPRKCGNRLLSHLPRSFPSRTWERTCLAKLRFATLRCTQTARETSQHAQPLPHPRPYRYLLHHLHRHRVAARLHHWRTMRNPRSSTSLLPGPQRAACLRLGYPRQPLPRYPLRP
jgi:hypothetical protein